ncbi:phosphoribosyltransferase [Hymenobacter latericus]|uniref:phosphoribosyltransferase n=1 Tax=Hymenobacter sp. YIM 151858-1 TaxID=2987688 RepID=UPI00222720AE|nr:phosphoribosyltransferase family protein [Hymenobacter sp. YIM 151858-1]UYZ57637.1 phosphoribosyltransferase family protein [Hymenobacter sp. YIM 151858-1]
MISQFENRLEAACLLAQQLQHLGLRPPGVVLAIPRGGVPVGAVVAQALGWPLELALTKKIGHPGNPEYAVGAVSETGYVLTPGLALPPEYLAEQIPRLQAQLRERRLQFVGNHPATPLQGRTVVITDDGVATGHTVLATIELVQAQRPARIVVAVPVSSPEALRLIETRVDAVVCLLAPPDFYAVGQYYRDFSETTDADVAAALAQARASAS